MGAHVMLSAMRQLISLVFVALVVACDPAEGVGSGTVDAGVDATAPTGAWPNTESAAMSDPWIVEHHDDITRMRPRIPGVDRLAVDDTGGPMRNFWPYLFY